MFFVFTLGFAMGCLTAWNFWSQPKWISNLAKKAVAAVTSDKTP